jgi:hypothetical protein
LGNIGCRIEHIHGQAHAVGGGLSDLLGIKLNLVLQLRDELFDLLVATAELFVRNLILSEDVLDSLRLLFNARSNENYCCNLGNNGNSLDALILDGLVQVLRLIHNRLLQIESGCELLDLAHTP